MAPPSPLIVETGPTPVRAVIWLHGLGASGYDFEPIVEELRLPEELAIRFIFPHAPAIPVTVNGGYVMPAWYDILEMDIDRRVDVERLLYSARTIQQLLDQQIDAGIEAKDILVAGFSQGGAVAYQACLSYDKPLAGLLAMSTYFATAGSITCHAANHELPILLQHGLYDPVVPIALAEKARDDLLSMGYAPEYRTYPMEHGVCPQQIEDIAAWLTMVLGQARR